MVRSFPVCPGLPSGKSADRATVGSHRFRPLAPSVLLQDGNVGLAGQPSKNMGLAPSCALQEALHFAPRDEEPARPLTGSASVLGSDTHLSGHPPLFLVPSVVRPIDGRSAPAIGVRALGQDSRTGTGPPRPDTQHPPQTLGSPKKPEVVPEHHDGVERFHSPAQSIDRRAPCLPHSTQPGGSNGKARGIQPYDIEPTSLKVQGDTTCTTTHVNDPTTGVPYRPPLGDGPVLVVGKVQLMSGTEVRETILAFDHLRSSPASRPVQQCSAKDVGVLSHRDGRGPGTHGGRARSPRHRIVACAASRALIDQSRRGRRRTRPGWMPALPPLQTRDGSRHVGSPPARRDMSDFGP